MCPVSGCIQLGQDFYPTVNPDTCIECGMCLKVCPGDAIDFDAIKADLRSRPHEVSLVGGIHQPFVGRAVDPGHRQRGASGGFVTQLVARLLETGRIDGAVMAGWSDETPWEPRPFVARTPAEVVAAAGSKYTAVPVASVMNELIGRGKDRYAFVGVSCAIQSARMFTRARPHLREKVPYMIGLLCNAMFDPEAATDLLQAAGLQPEEIVSIGYRVGRWPGIMEATTRDGRRVRLHQSNYKDGAYNYLSRLYTQPRCRQCFDWSNELSDLAAGDPWGRNESGGFTFPDGATLLLPRTDAGLELMDFAANDPTINVEPVSHDYVERTAMPMHLKKARSVSLEIRRRKSRGMPHAEYDRELPEVGWSTALKIRGLKLFRLLGKNRRIRYLTLRFLTSKLALPLVWLRQIRKYGFKGFWVIRKMEPNIADHNDTGVRDRPPDDRV